MDIPMQILPKRVAKSVVGEEASDGNDVPAVLSDSLCLGGRWGKGTLVIQQEVTTMEGWLRCSRQSWVHKDEEVGLNGKAVLGS